MYAYIGYQPYMSTGTSLDRKYATYTHMDLLVNRFKDLGLKDLGRSGVLALGLRVLGKTLKATPNAPNSECKALNVLM